MNTKKVGILILSAIVAGVVVSWTNANMFGFDWDSDNRMEMRTNFEWNEWSFGRMWGKHFKKWINGNMKWLTDEEKVELEAMSDDEKKVFFEEKRAERQADMEARKVDRIAHEAVIDKLIDGEALTAEEKVILEEIKVKRAERKAKMGERWRYMNR